MYRLFNEDVWFVTYQAETEDDYGDTIYPQIHIEYKFISLVESCYNMVVWLLENNYIEKS